MGLRDLFIRVRSIDADEARSFIDDHDPGSFTLLDVRQPGEYEKEHIPGAKIIPLPKLSDLYLDLDVEKPTLVYCAIGGRSLVAAKFLSGKGFEDVYNLKGGIKAWNGAKATGPQEFHLTFLEGGETLEAMLKVAYHMEDGLERFYSKLKDKARDRELHDLFAQLAAFEAMHMERVLELYLKLGLSDDEAVFDDLADEMGVMEGGYRMDEFLSRNKSYLMTPIGVLNVAMMIETQSLDLYSRLADTVADEVAEKFLMAMVDEEKMHLAALGDLLERKIETES
jgi:rhodanese-related sulfurtransferase/rubrerythrin